MRPFTTFPFDSDLPTRLWEWMAMYEEKTGGRVLAVPHNGNLSNGLMFATETPDGKPIDAAWAATRARWEPLYEITQGKGTSEQHPLARPERRVRRLRDLGQGQPQRGARSSPG